MATLHQLPDSRFLYIYGEMFLYQEENASTISEQTVHGLNRLVPSSCNNFQESVTIRPEHFHGYDDESAGSSEYDI